VKQSKNQSRIAFVERITERPGSDVRSAYLTVAQPTQPIAGEGAGVAKPKDPRTIKLSQRTESTNAQAPKAIEASPPAQTSQAEVERTATEHAGVKIYPITFKGEPHWSVQSEDNRTNGKVLGDTIHATLEGAKQSAEEQVRRVKSKQERNAAYEAEQAAAQAKKDANKGKSLADRKRDFDLDKPTKLPVQAGLGTGTRRESMQKAVDQDRHIASVMVEDTAAKKKDKATLELVRARGYILGASNENIPLVKQGLEAQARLKANKYEKPEYRVYSGRDDSGSFYEISKTEYDYAQELKTKPPVAHVDTAQQATESVAKAERQYHLAAVNEKTGAKTMLTRTPVTHAEAVTMKGKYDDKPGRRIQLEDVTPAQPDSVLSISMGGSNISIDLGKPAWQATHQDPGKAPEAATAPVIAQSLAKAGKNEQQSQKEMRLWLVGEIDKAVKLTEDYADYQESIKKNGQDIADSIFFGKHSSSVGLTTPQGNGTITFDVPGDGKFKIRNSLRGLMEFRAKVEAKSGTGFTDKTTKAKGLPASTGVAKGSSNQIEALSSMLEELDFEAAVDYARETGISLNDAKISPEVREQFKTYLKDGTEPKQFSPSRYWEYPGQDGADKDGNPIRKATLTKQIGADEYAALVVGTNATGFKYNITKNGKSIHAMLTSNSFANALKLAEDAINAIQPEVVKPKDTGWNMRGTGYAGKRYIGRNITLDDGREVVARIYENAGLYEEAEVKVDGARVFAKTDRYKAEKLADDFIKTLTAKAPEQDSGFPRPERPASADKYMGSEFDALTLEAKLIDHKNHAPKEGDRQAKKDAWYVELRALNEGLAEAKKRRSASLGAAPSNSADTEKREFRNPDTLNVLHNPIEDKDWFKLKNGEEWQARQGYSGRGWSLVRNGNLHPEARNFESQSDFIRSVIEVTGQTQAAGQVVAPVEANDEPIPAVSEAQARKQFEWRNMGQKDGNKSHLLFFFESEKDKGTGAAMNRGEVSLYPGASGWKVEDGDGTSYKSLADAKKAAIDLAIPKLQDQGYILKPAQAATAILDAANVTGKERIDALKDVKKGDITPEELQAAYPAKEDGEKTEPWKMTRAEAAESFPGDEYDKMLNRHAVLGDITYEESNKRSRINITGNKEFWAKTRKELLQDKKDAVKFARGDRAEVNKMKPTEGFAAWRIKSMSATGKAAIEAAGKYHDELLAVHKERVQEALDEGKDVPAEVLADYPDLAKPDNSVKPEAGGMQFSRSNTQNTGLTPAQFTAELAKAFGAKVAERLQAKGVVVPLADQSKLPAHVVPFLRDGDIIYGFYDPKTDRTYAVLENLTPEMVKGLVLHEVGVHFGFKAMLGDAKYANVMTRLDVMRRAGNKAVKEAYAQAKANSVRDSQVPEETLAYLVQSSPEMGIIKEIIARIKAFLFSEFGIGGKYLTEADMTMLARAAVDHSSRMEDGGSAVPAFMRNQGGRSADDYQPGTVQFNAFDTDERTKERLNRITDVEEEYRLPNIHQAVPKDYVPREASQKTVTIYRGVPNSVKDATIRPGDWVGLSKKYAADHGTGATGKSKVISIDVPADHVVWAGTDMNEWFYAPRQPNEPTAPDSGGALARGVDQTGAEANPDIRFSRTTVADGLQDGTNNPGSAKSLSAVTEAIKAATSPLGTVSLWDKTVGTQYHKATKDADFKRVFDGYNQQVDDTAHYAIEAEKQAPSILMRLESLGDVLGALKNSGAKQKADIKAVSTALFANIEGQKGVKQTLFDDATLKQVYNLTPHQIEMYRQARTAVDTSIERLAQTFAAQLGEDIGMPIEMAKNISLDDTVKLVKTFTETQENADELNDRLDGMLDHARFLKESGYMPALRFGEFAVTVTDKDGKVEHFEMFESKTMANLAKMKLAKEYPGATVDTSVMNPEQYAMFKGVSPETVEMFAKFTGMDKNEAAKEYIALSKSARSVKMRELQRKGTAGFSEDATRVLASFITSNARQSAINMNQGVITDALTSKSLAKKGDVQREAQKLSEYMNNPIEEARKLRGFMFMHFLGGSFASAIVNLTQPIMQTAPYLHQFAGARTAKIMASSAKMAASGNIEGKELQAAVKRAAEDGITEPQEIHQLMADAGESSMGGSLRARALIKAWGSMFSLAESFNRRITFIAAYQTAMETKQADPFEFARKAVIETQGLYSKVNRPNWARGAVGATIFTFRQFTISYLEFLSRLPKREKAIALTILVLAAGLQGLPGADDLEDLIDTIGQSMGYNTNSKKALRKLLVDNLGKDIGTILDVGLLSALSAVDVHGRLGMGNLLPGTSIFKPSETDKSRSMAELAGPLGGILTSFQKAMSKVQLGDTVGAITEVTPVAVRNLLKGIDMAKSGVYKDAKGYKVADVDLVDSYIKMVGFQPSDIAAKTRAISDEIQGKSMTTLMESIIAERWAQGVHEKDFQKVMDARRTLTAWNQNNPESRIVINQNQISSRVKKMNETRAQRFLKTVAKEQRGQVAEELR
jgi:hypothetical protein